MECLFLCSSKLLSYYDCSYSSHGRRYKLVNLGLNLLKFHLVIISVICLQIYSKLSGMKVELINSEGKFIFQNGSNSGINGCPDEEAQYRAALW